MVNYSNGCVAAQIVNKAILDIFEGNYKDLAIALLDVAGVTFSAPSSFVLSRVQKTHNQFMGDCANY